MILSLGQGEPSYVPDGLIGQAHDYADMSYLAFLQCYARDLGQWEIICFFSNHQNEWFTLEDAAAEMRRTPADLRERLEKLAAGRLLDERVPFTGPEYSLTRSPELRRLVVRLGSEWRCLSTRSE